MYVYMYSHALPFSIFSVRVDLRNACTVNNYIYINRRVLCTSLFFSIPAAKLRVSQGIRALLVTICFFFIKNDQFNLDIWGPP